MPWRRSARQERAERIAGREGPGEVSVLGGRLEGIAAADLDGDGDLDVVMGTSTMRPDATGPKTAQVRAYENLVGSESNWIKLRLIGKGPGGANRAAIGARRAWITWPFVLQGLVYTLLGGMAGIVISILLIMVAGALRARGCA